MQRPTNASSKAAAIRRRQLSRFAFLTLFLLTVVYAIYSHASTPANPSDLDGQRVAVHDVYDGDTITILTPSGGLEKLRLKGIDAPELARGEMPSEHFAMESKRYLFSRIDGRQITIRFDGTERRDRYGRLLAFIYLTDNDCINLSLVQNGYAYVDRRFDSFMRSQLGQAEGEARKKSRGLWKEVTDDQQPQWRQEWLTDRKRE